MKRLSCIFAWMSCSRMIVRFPLSGARNLPACSFVGMLISSLCLFPIDEHVMRIIKVATDNANTYYDIVSRLKRTHLRFSSVPPGQTVEFFPRPSPHEQERVIRIREKGSGD